MRIKKANVTENLRARAEDLLAQAKQSFQPADIEDINKLHHELAVRQAELELQNEELLQTQLSLQQVRDLHIELYEHAPAGYVLLDAAGMIRRTNATWRAMLKRSDDDFCGTPFADNLLEEDARVFLSRFRSLFHNPSDKQIELQIKRHNTKPFYAQITAKRSGGECPEKSSNELMVIVSDITERKQAEIIRDMGREILQILNESGDLETIIQRALTTLKIRTKVDSVGLRLQDEDDFPYFAQDGFSADFLLTENTLLERRTDGSICRDKDDNVCLECTCGLVLSGKTDASSPLFTKGGSCWTNDSFLLLDLPSDQDSRKHPRNNCIHQGFSSIALIPVRTKDRIVGLIQLNDKRKGRFTLKTIEMLEDIATNIGSVLMRKQAEVALQESESRWKFAIEGSGDGLWDWNVPQGKVFFSRRWKEMFGFAAHEIGSNLDEWSKRVHPEELAQVMAEVQLHLDGKTPLYSNEHRVRCKDGSWKWILDRGLVVERDAANNPLRVIGTHSDITERKQAQEAVHNLLNRFKLLAEHLPGFVYQYQLMPDGTSAFPYASPGIQSIYGLSPEAAAQDAERVFAVVHPDDLSRIGASIQHSAETLTLWHDCYRVFHPDGRLLWAEGRATPIRQLDGSTLWHGYIHDITERKEVEARLSESETKHRELIENTHDIIYTLTPEGEFTYVSPAWTILLGHPATEVEGHMFTEFIHADDLPACFEFLQKVLAGQRQEGLEYRVQHINGEWRWHTSSATPAKDTDGLVIGYEGIARDITERKQAEQELIEQKNAYRSILSTTHEGFFVANERGKILDVNPAYLRLSGYSYEEMLKLNISDLEAHEMADEVILHVKRVMKVGSDIFESRHKRKDGSIWPVEISTTYSSLNENRFFTFVRDITERKKSQWSLQQKNQEMEQFVYSVSHDLKSPLVTVKTFAGMLRQDLQNADQPQINEDLDYIDKAADKMQQLLDALLQYSRIGTIDTPAQTLPADQPAEDCLTALAGILQNHEVKVSSSELNQQLHGNPLHFAQVWQNLIENAVKYCGDQPHPLIEIGATQPGQDVVFYVRDNDIGIAPEHNERIFNLFSQLTPGSEGSGLGLALVKKIVSIYQGRIWVESEGHGKGTCFMFTLPGALNGNEVTK